MEKNFQNLNDNIETKRNYKNNDVKNLILFFLITFLWSNSFWFAEIFTGKRFYLGPFVPTFAAFILTFAEGKWEAVKKLLKRGISLNFKKIWLTQRFLLMPTIIGLSLVIAILIGEKVPEFSAFKQPLMIIPAFFMIFFLKGPLAEEFGWRGYALNKIQKKFNALISCIILGFIW